MAKFGYVMVYVENVAETRAFYEKHFGMALVEGDGETFASLGMAESPGGAQTGGTLLALHGGEPAAGPEKTCLYFEVEDFDECFARMTAAGAHFHVPPENTPWGKRQASTHDPAGHTVGIYSRIR